MLVLILVRDGGGKMRRLDLLGSAECGMADMMPEWEDRMRMGG